MTDFDRYIEGARDRSSWANYYSTVGWRRCCCPSAIAPARVATIGEETPAKRDADSAATPIDSAWPTTNWNRAPPRDKADAPGQAAHRHRDRAGVGPIHLHHLSGLMLRGEEYILIALSRAPLQHPPLKARNAVAANLAGMNPQILGKMLRNCSVPGFGGSIVESR